MDIIYHPIGVAKTPFKMLDGMPIQPSRAQGTQGAIEVSAEYVAGLKDLSGFSHILVVSHLHLMTPGNLVVVPFLDTEPRGIRRLLVDYDSTRTGSIFITGGRRIGWRKP